VVGIIAREVIRAAEASVGATQQTSAARVHFEGSRPGEVRCHGAPCLARGELAQNFIHRYALYTCVYVCVCVCVCADLVMMRAFLAYCSLCTYVRIIVLEVEDI